MSAPKTVTLTDPNGLDCNVSSPVEVTNLVYGAGYKVKGHKTAEDAIAALAANVDPEPETAKPAK
jgi:hypothetical protein